MQVYQKPDSFIFLIQSNHVNIEEIFHFYLIFYDLKLVIPRGEKKTFLPRGSEF